MEAWRPGTNESLEGAVVLHLAIHHPNDPAVLGRGIARLEERAGAVRKLQTERRRWRIAAVHALRASDRRAQDPRHPVFDLSRDRGPGRLRLSALPRHWTSFAATTRVLPRRSLRPRWSRCLRGLCPKSPPSPPAPSPCASP